jgi:hypothetical protein
VFVLKLAIDEPTATGLKQLACASTHYLSLSPMKFAFTLESIYEMEDSQTP